MSFITEIEAIFKDIHSDGTFNFTSEARQDQYLRNIGQANFPICVIDDEVVTNGTILPGSEAQESPNIRIYFLTKFDTSDNPSEYDETRRTQESELVEPMKELAWNVIARYLRNNANVWRSEDDLPSINITDQYDIWSKGLCGVLVIFQHARRRSINYCSS